MYASKSEPLTALSEMVAIIERLWPHNPNVALRLEEIADLHNAKRFLPGSSHTSLLQAAAQLGTLHIVHVKD